VFFWFLFYFQDMWGMSVERTDIYELDERTEEFQKLRNGTKGRRFVASKKDVDMIKMANGRQVGGINRSQSEDCFLESDKKVQDKAWKPLLSTTSMSSDNQTE
jgi:hypothetical protein